MIEVLCDEFLDEVLANPQEYVEQGAFKPLVRIATKEGTSVEVFLGAEHPRWKEKEPNTSLHYFIEVRPVNAPENIWQTVWDFDFPKSPMSEIFDLVVKTWNK